MGESTHILVVDDNLAMLGAVARLLRAAGHEVLEADTGEKALRVAREHHPALILLDVRLPDANGIDICRTIKSDPSFADTFVALLSSVDITPDSQIIGLEAGADSYIARPVHNRELVARVVALLRIQRTERRLRESETLWRTVFAAANDAMLLLNDDLSIRACNRSALDLYGFSEEELLAMGLEELCVPHPGEETPSHPELLARETRFVVETEHRRRDGSVVPVEVSGTPFREGARTGFIYAVRDITDRKRTERETSQLVDLVEYQSRKLHSIVANVPGIVWEAWKHPGSELPRIDFVSDYALKMLGYPTDEWITVPDFWLTIAHPDDRDRASRETIAIFSGGGNGRMELRMIAADGRVVWVEAYSTVIIGEDGMPAGLRGVMMDVTERKLAEEEIRRLNSDLERRVLERTAQLQAANRELEAFSYSVSHDLRAPFRHIVGFADLLNKRIGTGLDESGKHYLDTISQSAKYAGTLVDNLLSFSQMGRTELRHMKVDMGQLVREVIADMEQETEGRTIEWTIAALPTIEGDASMLRLAVDNLLANAIKYTRPRKVAKIEVGMIPGEGERIFFVRDNGVGFDIRYAGKLFGVFQRLHRSEEFEGTGIGLANVQRIVQRHGGRVWAEGIEDEGATFYFSIPTSTQE
jgi:PAS domain S-box-containing protein